MNHAATLRTCSATSAALLLGLAVAAAMPPSASAYPSNPGTGVTVNNAALVNPGTVLYTSPEDITYLVNQNGDVVRTLTSPIPGTSIAFARPLANKNLLARLRTPAGSPEILLEMTLAGAPVWYYIPVGYHLHHDHLRLANGNTLALCDRTFAVVAISPIALRDDCIIEIDPAGNVVWSWQTAQHFHQFGFSDETRARISDNGGDWAHANAIAVFPPNAPADDPRFRPGNIMISYRHINTIAVIDKDTGALAATFQNYTVGQHNVQMIPMGLPGGGNILVFDNGYSDPVLNPAPAARNGAPLRDYSRVLEFNPRDPGNPVWEYRASMSQSRDFAFFSSFISAAQRLPNGNTFITEGMDGRLFEVTPTGEIVWEYVSPHQAVRQGGLSNQIYRAYKLAAPAVPN